VYYDTTVGSKKNDSVAARWLLILCCVIKPIATWHAENSITTCRERCGGQGYLSVNKFGVGLSGAHAGMTAEGDNSVLMQKVSKEVLEMVRDGHYSLQSNLKKPTNFEEMNTEILKYLFTIKETTLFTNLSTNMAIKAPKAGVFQVWMKEESDLVQGAARAFGERLILDQFIRKVEQETNSGVKSVLHLLLALYGWSRIEADLGWFLSEEKLSPQEGKRVREFSTNLCTKLGPQIVDIVNAFGFPDHALQAPVAMDWVKYNSVDNRGELDRNPPLWL